MNVATVKTLLWLVSLGLAGGLGYYAWDTTQNKEGKSYWDKDYATSVLQDVKEPERPPATTIDYRAVVLPTMDPSDKGFDWTGKPAPPPPEPTNNDKPVVEAPRVQVADLMSVMMINWAPMDPDKSWVFVTWKQPAMAEALPYLTPGMSLPKPHDKIKVWDIRENEIEFTFTNNPDWENQVLGTPVNLELLSLVPTGEAAREPVKELNLIGVARPSGPRPERTVPISKNNFQVGGLDAQEFAENYDQILTRDLKTETYFKDGKRAGIKISEVRPGSIAARHGAQDGDVIISINGHPVSSQQEAINWAKQQPETTTEWNVVVQRLGRLQTMTFHNPQS